MEATKVDRVDAIIRAALAEFIEKGYEETSMNQIAERANLSKGGLYHHFISKEEILFVVNNEIMRPIVEMMRVAESNANPLIGLRDFIKGYISFWINHKKELEVYLIAISKLLHSEKNKIVFNEYVNNMKKFIELLLIKGVEHADFKKNNTKQISSLLFTVLDGNLIRIASEKDCSGDIIIEEIENIIIEPILFKLTWF